jgi:hypothetical protein
MKVYRYRKSWLGKKKLRKEKSPKKRKDKIMMDSNIYVIL